MGNIGDGVLKLPVAQLETPAFVPQAAQLDI